MGSRVASEAMMSTHVAWTTNRTAKRRYGAMRRGFFVPALECQALPLACLAPQSWTAFLSLALKAIVRGATR